MVQRDAKRRFGGIKIQPGVYHRSLLKAFVTAHLFRDDSPPGDENISDK